MGKSKSLFSKTVLRKLARRVADRTVEVNGANYFFGMLHSRQDVSTEYFRALITWRTLIGIFFTKRLSEELIDQLRSRFAAISLKLREGFNLYLVDVEALRKLEQTGSPPIAPARWWENVRGEVAEVDGFGWLLWRLDPALEKVLRKAGLIEGRLPYKDVPEQVKKTLRLQARRRQTNFNHPVYKINLKAARRLERTRKVPGTP